MTHVPYKGAGPALNDLLGSHVDMYFPGFPAVTPLVKAGSLKILAVSSATRAPSAPDIPTVAEVAGIKNFDFTLWQGIFAPRGTPAAVVTRLNSEINKILASDDIKKKFADLGAEIRPMSVAAVHRLRAGRKRQIYRGDQGYRRHAGVKPVYCARPSPRAPCPSAAP